MYNFVIKKDSEVKTTHYLVIDVPMPNWICHESIKITSQKSIFLNSILIQDDYKLCEQLHKFIGKKVIATQKLNSHHCKEQLRKFFQT
jgi:hypothetical protein